MNTNRKSIRVFGCLKTIIQESWPYRKDSGDFINQISQIRNISEKTILVTSDVVGLYPSNAGNAGLKVLENALEKRKRKPIPTEKSINMAESMLKNNFFELNVSAKQQASETAVSAKCALPYTYIIMNEIDNEFLKIQERTPLV